MILYLGLDPSRYPQSRKLLHYPVIRTEKIHSESFLQAKVLWPQFTHVIFTSKTAVSYWFEEETGEGKIVIAVGKSTAEELEKRGIDPLVAKRETQEGVIELLETLDLRGAYIFWPRSKRARPVLESYLSHMRYCALDLYDTVLQKPEPVPDLREVDEIVFTSPSTVRGFLAIYGFLPKNKTLRAIGPVTRESMDSLQPFSKDMSNVLR